MSKTEFKPKDFGLLALVDVGNDCQRLDIDKLVERCNKRLAEIKEAWKAEMLKDAAVVYWQDNKGTFLNLGTEKMSHDTHKALLIQVEPIVKEPCKHEPNEAAIYKQYTTCIHCGVELVAEWKEKK